jgi:hypothetical protein
MHNNCATFVQESRDMGESHHMSLVSCTTVVQETLAFSTKMRYVIWYFFVLLQSFFSDIVLSIYF